MKCGGGGSNRFSNALFSDSFSDFSLRQGSKIGTFGGKFLIVLKVVVAVICGKKHSEITDYMLFELIS